MRVTTLVAILVLSASHAFGTAQTPEVLIHNGVTNEMFSTPLDAYFSTNNPIPEVWKSFLRRGLHHFGSGCWRGYVGTWEIKTNHLYLTDLALPGPPLQTVADGKTNTYFSPLSLLLPEKDLPIRADCFSGVIQLPQGKELQYVHMGFGSIYERDHFIKIEKGKVVAEKTIDNLDNPKLYTSQADLEWQEIGKMTEGGGLITDDPFAPQTEQKDRGNWRDARMVRTTNFLHIVQSETNFTTRGILIIRKDELFGDAYHLTVPPTPLTEWVDLPLEEVPAKASGLNGAHVEIEANFRKGRNGYQLHVKNIRMLKGGETIHRHDYRLPNKLFQNTANEPPKGDPFADPEE